MSIISIMFDDGYKDTFLSCAGFLMERSIKASFAVPSGLIGETLEGRQMVDEDDIKNIYGDGHEIMSHSLMHRNLLDVYNGIGEDMCQEEFSVSRQILERITGKSVEHFVFPFIDANNDRKLRSIASEYYRSSRVTVEGLFLNQLPVPDRYYIKGSAVTLDHDINSLNTIADMVYEHDYWVIEVFHLVARQNTKSANRDEPYRFYTNVSIFKEHIEYLLRKGLNVLPYSDVIEKYCK